MLKFRVKPATYSVGNWAISGFGAATLDKKKKGVTMPILVRLQVAHEVVPHQS